MTDQPSESQFDIVKLVGEQTITISALRQLQEALVAENERLRTENHNLRYPNNEKGPE